MQHRISATVVTMGIAWLAALTARADMLPTAPVTDDLWDAARGTVITAQTARSGSTDGIAMFGGTSGTWEPANVLFADGHSPDYVHYVSWQTAAPVTIGAFNLFASTDASSSSDPSYCRRSFARFRLYAWDGTQFNVVFDAVPSLPYSSPVFSVTLAQPVTSRKWRAEFDQQVYTKTYSGVAAGYYGPRIKELDGFLPEPATLTLLALSGLVLRRRR